MVGVSPKSTSTPAGGKSGLIKFKPGEVIFNQNDTADCLYIIQKGQIRLFIPKGRGFVDLAILRTGEVIGEMAYFDEKASRRSCSAAAIVSTEVIKISFTAFDKTMQGLNPWFKTIINTLADRLRKTNDKVRELESNSVGYAAAGKVSNYKFFHTTDVLKVLSTMFLVAKSHGELVEGKVQIHLNKLKYYLYDIYNVQEIKYEELIHLMTKEHYVEIANDDDNLPKIVRFHDVDGIRSILVFLNSERLKDDDKKTRVSPKCERLLGKMLQQAKVNGLKGDRVVIDLSLILEEFKENKINVNDQDLFDAVNIGLCDDIVVGDYNKLSCTMYYKKVMKVFPALRLSNAIEAANQEKSGELKYS